MIEDVNHHCATAHGTLFQTRASAMCTVGAQIADLTRNRMRNWRQTSITGQYSIGRVAQYSIGANTWHAAPSSSPVLAAPIKRRADRLAMRTTVSHKYAGQEAYAHYGAGFGSNLLRYRSAVCNEWPVLFNSLIQQPHSIAFILRGTLEGRTTFRGCLALNLAEEVRFELTEDSHPRRFSRPVP
jgi:hypothetical protein